MTNDDRPDVNAPPAAGRRREAVRAQRPGPGATCSSARWAGGRDCCARGPPARSTWPRKIEPDLIRAYGVHLNALAAREVKRELGVPYVVSLHTNPHWDVRRHPKRERNRRADIQNWRSGRVERAALSHADAVVCVYRYLEPSRAGWAPSGSSRSTTS